MQDTWVEKWNDRYRKEEFAFGTDPNVYLKQQLEKLNPGKILFPAEGEGRNAVFAAKLGWKASAFDISVEGKRKAQRLAERNDVTIDYQVGQLEKLTFEDQPFDVIALIYAHFPADIRSKYHQILDGYLKKGGTIILEAFGKNHLEYRAKNPQVGGPRDLPTLLSIEEIKADFTDYEIIELVEKEVDLKEGLYHVGKGSAVRFIGRKL